MPTTDVSDSRFARNVALGTTNAGGLFLETYDSELRNNIISLTGGPGMIMNSACRDVLTGNNFQGAGDVGLVLGSETGANTYVGNPSIVVDNGSFDCDGDGNIDPNVLTGQGTPLIGLTVPHLTGLVSTNEFPRLRGRGPRR